MAEENTYIPQIDNSPEALEAERIRRRDEELRKYWLDPRVDYPEPYFMLEYNGVPFSTVGGIQAVTGQKKNGKTFLLTMLMAAILGRDSDRVKEYLPGLTVPERTIEYLGHEPSVLFVDTEMEQLSSAKVLRRVHCLCGWDMKEPSDRFHIQWLRSVKRDDKEEVYQKRYRLICNAIESVDPDFVIIDGLRDLLGSINEEEPATRLISDLSAMAEERQMCIWTALHQNPRPSNDLESKMRGWAGTELGNKVSDTFLSKKDKRGTEVLFTVKQDDARNKDVDDFQFIITDAVGNLGIPKIITPSPLKQTIEQVHEGEEQKIAATINVLKRIIYPPDEEFLTTIKIALKKELHCGDDKAMTYWNSVRNRYPALIYQTKDRKYTISKKELEAYENGLPFAP